EAAIKWKTIKSASEIDSKIKEYLTTPINPYNIPTIRTSHPSSIMEIEPVSHLSTTIEVEPTIEIS
ncbi:1098_t:CDS:1, partial [Cetraspora pellucida]